MTLLAELRRRNVFRMAGLYVVGAWLLTQVASTVLPAFDVPGWALRGLIIVLVLGFVPALIFAWVFELTPAGIKRDADVGPEDSIAPQTAPRPLPAIPGLRGTRTPAQRLDRTIIVVLLVALGYFAFDKFVLAPRRDAATQPEAATVSAKQDVREASRPVAEKSPDTASRAIPADNSIAVLPFVNMSSDKEQEFFSDGLSEELLNLLAQLPQLRVIARTSSFSFKGKEVDVATIAKALNVANVLEGSVRKSGNTLRITTQLIRAADSSHLWSQTYDRELTDVFKVQDEIANEVVAALKLRLLSDQVITNAHRSSNIEAYTQYLLAKNFAERGTMDDWQRAIAAFRRAIALDPQYAAAYAGLAGVEASSADRSGDGAALEQAFADAEKAVALAPDLADGYLARATFRISYEHDWNGARTDLDKALALSPGESRTHLGYSGLMRALGRVPEAIAAARKAIDLDPLRPGSWVQMGRLHNGTGDFPAARQALERALQISPEFEAAHFHRGVTSLLEGKPDDALADFRKSGRTYSNAGIAIAEHTLGHASESQAALETEIAGFAGGAAYQIAEVYAWRGEKDKAFEWLERALAQRDGGLSFMQVDPLLASLRSDARYGAFLQKIGLPQ